MLGLWLGRGGGRGASPACAAAHPIAAACSCPRPHTRSQGSHPPATIHTHSRAASRGACPPPRGATRRAAVARLRRRGESCLTGGVGGRGKQGEGGGGQPLGRGWRAGSGAARRRRRRGKAGQERGRIPPYLRLRYPSPGIRVALDQPAHVTWSVASSAAPPTGGWRGRCEKRTTRRQGGTTRGEGRRAQALRVSSQRGQTRRDRRGCRARGICRTLLQ